MEQGLEGESDADFGDWPDAGEVADLVGFRLQVAFRNAAARRGERRTRTPPDDGAQVGREHHMVPLERATETEVGSDRRHFQLGVERPDLRRRVAVAVDGHVARRFRGRAERPVAGHHTARQMEPAILPGSVLGVETAVADADAAAVVGAIFGD